jgi:DNA replication protein DnaC
MTTLKRLSDLLGTDKPDEMLKKMGAKPQTIPTVPDNTWSSYQDIKREADYRDARMVNADVWCDTCWGYGSVQETPFVVGNRPQIVRCPNPDCAAADKIERNRANLLMTKYNHLPENYGGYTFESWVGLHWRQKQGKETAEAVTKYFAHHPRTVFSMEDSIRFSFPDDKTEVIPPNFDSDKKDHWDERLRVTYATEEGEKSYTIPNSRGSGLVLSGEKGTGKTGMAVAAYNHLKTHTNLAVAYIHLPSLLDEIRDTYDKSYAGKPVWEITDPIKTADILIVDEFNTQAVRASDHSREIVQTSLITPRWNNWGKKPMLITTNCSPSDFEEMWGSLISSRVMEMCHWVNVGGLVLRRKNKPV